MARGSGTTAQPAASTKGYSEDRVASEIQVLASAW